MHGSRYAAGLTVFARCHYDGRRHKRPSSTRQPSVTTADEQVPKGVEEGRRDGAEGRFGWTARGRDERGGGRSAKSGKGERSSVARAYRIWRIGRHSSLLALSYARSSRLIEGTSTAIGAHGNPRSDRACPLVRAKIILRV
ncbi:hypothetical protein KM043_016189 [Ampulex compressa]|nr:hypothetical protein KM043_016189 [Ampulex compressa]